MLCPCCFSTYSLHKKWLSSKPSKKTRSGWRSTTFRATVCWALLRKADVGWMPCTSSKRCVDGAYTHRCRRARFILGTILKGIRILHRLGSNVPRRCKMIRSPSMQWPVHAKSHGNGEGPCSTRVSQMWSHAMCTVAIRVCQGVLRWWICHVCCFKQKNIENPLDVRGP